MYRLVENDVEFWANLPWIENGRKLWNHVKDFNPHILSDPYGKSVQSLENAFGSRKNLGLVASQSIFRMTRVHMGLTRENKAYLSTIVINISTSLSLEAAKLLNMSP